MSEGRDKRLDGRKRGALWVQKRGLYHFLLVHDVGCLFVVDVVLLWLGEDKRKQKHQNNGTTGTTIASNSYGSSAEYTSAYSHRRVSACLMCSTDCLVLYTQRDRTSNPGRNDVLGK